MITEITNKELVVRLQRTKPVSRCRMREDGETNLELHKDNLILANNKVFRYKDGLNLKAVVSYMSKFV